MYVVSNGRPQTLSRTARVVGGIRDSSDERLGLGTDRTEKRTGLPERISKAPTDDIRRAG